MMKKFKSLTKRRNRSGQALVEYTLVLALIVVVAIAMLKAIGQSVQNQLSAVNSGLTTGS
jgi:Flp pilus assembly pilin Flp